MGRPWFLPTLTALTFGRRDGETYYFGAGTGVGKTDFFTQQIEYDVSTLNVKTACIYLEQPPSETGKRIAGKKAGKLFHIPNLNDEPEWTQEELLQAFDELEATGNLYLGGNFSSADWDQIKARIRYLVHGLGVKHIFLDHLTALADPSNERESLEIITKELALLAQELRIIIHVISHLATPDGKPHEEGGRVMLRHFKGSRAIGFWAHFAFGLERNPQDEDAMAAQQTTFRCLKDRYTGRANGKTITLGYNVATGIISEANGFEAVDAGGLEV
jgi:twinkle protein